MKYEIGHILILNNFSFRNKAGGTGLSDWKYDEKYNGEPVKIRITKVWDDEETGFRGWGEPLNQELKDYLSRNASQEDKTYLKGSHENYICGETFTIPANTVYWDEYAIKFHLPPE